MKSSLVGGTNTEVASLEETISEEEGAEDSSEERVIRLSEEEVSPQETNNRVNRGSKAAFFIIGFPTAHILYAIEGESRDPVAV